MHAWRRSMLLFAQRALCIAMAGTAPALAGEVQTECPLAHPEKPDVHLRSGECLPDGGPYPWSWRPDEVIDHGNNIRTDVDIYRRDTKHDPLHKAKLECNYKDRTTVHIPVPGALLRCGIKYYLPDLDNLKPGENPDPQIRDVWAISEVDDKPEPSK